MIKHIKLPDCVLSHEPWGDVKATKIVKAKVFPENIWPAWSLRNWVGQNAYKKTMGENMKKYRISIYIYNIYNYIYISLPRKTLFPYISRCAACNHCSNGCLVPWWFVVGTLFFKGGILLPTAHTRWWPPTSFRWFISNWIQGSGRCICS